MKNQAFTTSKRGPTTLEQSERIVRLVAIMATLQFFLSGLQNVASGWPMLVIWMVSGLIVGLATKRIERYFAKRRRMGT